MKNDFKTFFQDEIALEVDFGPVMRFSLMRDKNWITTFVFVEGSTDKIFYINTNIPKLTGDAYYFYRTVSDGYNLENFKGKEAVYYCLSRITKNEKLSNYLDRCVFIVDKDYDQQPKSKFVRLTSEDYKKIQVTKGHSMESYFFEKSNLTNVLKTFNLSEEPFMSKFEEFSQLMSKFYALRAVITNKFYTNSKITFKKKYTDEDLFVFDFKQDDFWISKDKVIEESERMKNVLTKYPYMMREVEKLEEDILSNNMNLRGHDSFNFLSQYIKQFTNNQITFPKGEPYEVKSLLKNFNVEFFSINDILNY